ncbi:glycosyltransferase family 2 protein [Bifidobacterium animalis]|uniref:glycosyltransferase family 2 protein n=1 Tax=Bifidobacterium animalis TaxID=28025 RepID=UPI003F8FD398
MKVSIVVPVYNAEAYLSKCVTSILTQTHSDLELILVDDGSVDNSPVLCDEFASADTRVQVHHIKNAGPGHARNYGISKAAGDYLLLVDSDDYISSDALELLVDKAVTNHADLVCYNFDVFDSNNNATRASMVKNPFPTCTKSTSRENLQHIYHHNLENYAWCYLYKMSAVHKYHFHYEERYSFMEDMVTLNHFLRNPMSVSYMDTALYHYRDTQTSITHTISYKTISDAVYAISDVMDLCQKDGSIGEYADFAFYHLIAADYRNVLAEHPDLDRQMGKAVRRAYAALPAKTTKDKVVMMLYRMHAVQKVYKIYMRIKTRNQ